jgi:hypothetical protein
MEAAYHELGEAILAVVEKMAALQVSEVVERDPPIDAAELVALFIANARG